MKFQRIARPFLGIFGTPDELGGEDRMAITEDVHPYLDRLPRDTLDRKTARVHGRIDVFDVDPLAGQAADQGKAHICCHIPDRTLSVYRDARRKRTIRLRIDG